MIVGNKNIDFGMCIRVTSLCFKVQTSNASHLSQWYPTTFTLSPLFSKFERESVYLSYTCLLPHLNLLSLHVANSDRVGQHNTTQHRDFIHSHEPWMAEAITLLITEYNEVNFSHSSLCSMLGLTYSNESDF